MTANPPRGDPLKAINADVTQLKKLLAPLISEKTPEKLINNMQENLRKILETHQADRLGGHAGVPPSHNHATTGVNKAVKKLKIPMGELINKINSLAVIETKLEDALESLNGKVI